MNRDNYTEHNSVDDNHNIFIAIALLCLPYYLMLLSGKADTFKDIDITMPYATA